MVAGKRTVDVEEVVWLDDEARLALYGWMASLSDQWGHILYRAHPEEGFPGFLSEHQMPLADLPRWHHWFPSAVILNGPMFRLLHLERAWIERPVRTHRPLVLNLDVQDEQLPENRGSWTLAFSEGRIEVAAGTGTRADLEMRTGIETLSRLYIGALAPSAAFATRLLSADRPERLGELDSILRLPQPWTYDRF
jgi:predicted acetyltransferase